MKFFKNLLLGLLSILTLAPTFAQSKGQYKIVQTATGPQSFTRANILSRWVPVASLDGYRLTPASILVGKDYDGSLTYAPGQFNYDRNGTFALPHQFQYLDYGRDAQKPLSTILKQQQLLHYQSLLPHEAANADNYKYTYFELNANVLGHYEGRTNFFLASTQDIINQLASTVMGIPKNVARISTNWENCYPFYPDAWDKPNETNPDLYGVKQHYPNAEQIYIVCECDALKGQRLSLKEIWDRGQFRNEVDARFANHHVAGNLFLEAMVPGAMVTNGDGCILFCTASPAYDYNNRFRDYMRLQGGSTFGYDFAWYTRSNFGKLSAGGLTIESKSRTLWETQDWANNYTYPYVGVLDPADFDQAVNGRVTYEWLWDRVKPDPQRLDLCLPMWHQINRAWAGKHGMGNLPYTYQTHRYEFGYRRGTEGDTRHTLGHYLPDLAQCPPWHTKAVAMLSAFNISTIGDGLTVWKTFKTFNGSQAEANTAANRPQANEENYRTGLYQISQFPEYLAIDGSAVHLYPNQVYLNYEVDGGAWGENVEDGGEGYYKRSYRDIAFVENREDRRTKASVQVRLIQKAGKVWAEILAFNWAHQSQHDKTRFALRIKPGQHPGLLSQVDITGLEITGYDPLHAEICLTP